MTKSSLLSPDKNMLVVASYALHSTLTSTELACYYRDPLLLFIFYVLHTKLRCLVFLFQ